MSRVKCLLCGEVLESTHRYDFVQCGCDAVFLDGGDVYLRIGGNPDNYEILPSP